MLDLSRSLNDELVIGSRHYQLDLSFGNVLRLFEMWHDNSVPTAIKPYLALQMLTDESFFEYSVEDALSFYTAIFDEHIQIRTASDDIVEYDLAGNIMPKRVVSDDEDDEEPIYSLKYDSDYIYASFMQAYGIDLIDVQNTLHWQKFNALLGGLPKNTKFAQVLEIRTWKPSKHDSSDYKEHMRRLQKHYKLPEQ